ncbi:MAG TPA: CHASE3 domain-containing protein [Verrucomicrobiae bacterium]
MKNSVENKIIFGFAISLAALLGIGWLSYRTTTNLVATENWVSHTRDVIATLESGLAILADAETSQRGYLLTGDAKFLEDSLNAQAQLKGWGENLQKLTADNPEQVQRLEKLKSLISQRLAVLNNRIQLRQQHGLQAAAEAVALRDGKNAMDQVRRQISEMHAAEDRLLAQRQQEAQAGAKTSETIILIGSVLACVIGLLAIFLIHRDLRLRKQAEEKIEKLNVELERRAGQLEIANKELEAFSYSVSHDLRAPLRHIDGFVDLLNRHAVEKLDERSRRYLKIIAGSAHQMGVLIDDLLVFSRMGRTELRQSKVALNSLLSEAVDALQMETKDRQIVWKINSLPEVEADAAMLRQVWANLIGNAVKYTRPRAPAEIEVSCRDSGNGEFIFSVRDNGVGFDMQYAHKLFGVFQRLHRSEDFEGTGIGLANVNRIVNRHGGRVWAEGKIDSGATFFFSLPKTKTETKE